MYVVNHQATVGRSYGGQVLSRIAPLIAGLLCALAVSGCASMGQEFPSGMVSELRVGQTTQAEVRQMFGSPWRVGVENGTRTWTYGKYRYSLLEAISPSETEDLVIQFDGQGVVSSYAYNTTRHQE